jgi:hypothetical protein
MKNTINKKVTIAREIVIFISGIFLSISFAISLYAWNFYIDKKIAHYKKICSNLQNKIDSNPIGSVNRLHNVLTPHMYLIYFNKNQKYLHINLRDNKSFEKSFKNYNKMDEVYEYFTRFKYRTVIILDRKYFFTDPAVLAFKIIHSVGFREEPPRGYYATGMKILENQWENVKEEKVLLMPFVPLNEFRVLIKNVDYRKKVFEYMKYRKIKVELRLLERNVLIISNISKIDFAKLKSYRNQLQSDLKRERINLNKAKEKYLSDRNKINLVVKFVLVMLIFIYPLRLTILALKWALKVLS